LCLDNSFAHHLVFKLLFIFFWCAVKREICPHGKQAPHRLTLMIPENWLQQVVALQSGVVRPTTGQPSAPGNAEDAEEPAAAPAAADVKQEDGGELGQPETEPAATAEEAATHVSGEGVNGKVEDQGAPAVEPSAGSPAVDGSQAER